MLRVVHKGAFSVPPDCGITPTATHQIAVFHRNTFFFCGGAGFDAIAGAAGVHTICQSFPFLAVVHTAIHCVQQLMGNGIFCKLVIHIVLQQLCGNGNLKCAKPHSFAVTPLLAASGADSPATDRSNRDLCQLQICHRLTDQFLQVLYIYHLPAELYHKPAGKGKKFVAKTRWLRYDNPKTY